MDKKGIITLPDNNIESKPKITGEEIKNYLCKDADESDIKIALSICNSTGMNPFVRDVDFIKYDKNKPMRIVVRKDWFFKVANKQPSYGGMAHGIIVSRNNEIVYQDGAFYLPTDTLLGGWAEVYINNKAPHRSEVSLSEYDSKQSLWLKMPATMINKVAKVQALREAFAEQFQGIVDESEMGVIKEVNNNAISQTEIKSVEVVEATKPESSESTFTCSECSKTGVKKSEKDYSEKRFGRIICYTCNQGLKS